MPEPQAHAPTKQTCPHCGSLLRTEPSPAVEHTQNQEREYDRRGVLLPRRTRVGGIITPQ
jgi:hypothetical protein